MGHSGLEGKRAWSLLQQWSWWLGWGQFRCQRSTRGWPRASSSFCEKLQLVTWENFLASPVLW